MQRIKGELRRIKGEPMSDERTTRLLLTPRDAAEALAISERKLWGITASKEIPHIRVGRCVRYPVADLQRWIAARKDGGRSLAV